MRAHLQPGQPRARWGAVVTSSICILLVAQSCAAQTIPGPGTIRGTVTDSSLSAVEAGAYALTITAAGFADQKTDVSVVSGENPPLPPVVLQIAPALTKVDVTLPPHELAVQQVHAEEKQRLLGIIPNFYVTYEPNAAPLTAAQKFHLGLRTLIDPETILGNAAGAGIEQWRNTTDRQFGQGMEGYAKRFGVDYA